MPIESVASKYGENRARQHGAMEYSDPPVDLDQVRLYRLGRLRDELKKRYDFILLDSRTGLTDIGGICTVQLPDLIVMVSTPSAANAT